MFTAIILSKEPVAISIPGVQVLNSVQTVSGPAQFLQARFDALQRVTTPWCFYLDDDDELPTDYLDVLAECAGAGKPLSYTNQIERRNGKETVRVSGPYSQAAHLSNMMLVHALAVMDTAQAQAAAPGLPRGRYWPEMLLYWQLAKGGAHWVDRVGHIWNRTDGMSTLPSALESQVRSAIWCAANRG